MSAPPASVPSTAPVVLPKPGEVWIFRFNEANQIIYLNDKPLQYLQLAAESIVGKEASHLEQWFDSRFLHLLNNQSISPSSEMTVHDSRTGLRFELRHSRQGRERTVACKYLGHEPVASSTAPPSAPTPAPRLPSFNTVQRITSPERQYLSMLSVVLQSDTFSPYAPRDEFQPLLETLHQTAHTFQGQLENRSQEHLTHSFRHTKNRETLAHPLRALMAACHQVATPTPDGASISISAALDTGDEIPGLNEEEHPRQHMLGAPSRTAERLARLAAPGTILLTENCLREILLHLPKDWQAARAETGYLPETPEPPNETTTSPLPLEIARQIILLGPYALSRPEEAHFAFQPVFELKGLHPLQPSTLVYSVSSGHALLATTHVDAASVEPMRLADSVQTFGPWRLLQFIGSGSMADVWKALDRDHHVIALKIFRPDAPNSRHPSYRMRRAADKLRFLNHPQIARIHETTEIEGIAAIAMEYIPGPHLAQLLDPSLPIPYEEEDGIPPSLVREAYLRRPQTAPDNSEPAPPRLLASHQAHQLASTLSIALEYCHQNGILHKNIAPHNILIRPDGTPVLTDFCGSPLEGMPADTWLQGHTMAAVSYSAPELIDPNGYVIDERADVFSLGAILHYLLTGQPHFQSTGNLGQDAKLLTNHTSQEIESLNEYADRGLAAIARKALQPNPENRYASIGALLEDLKNSRRGRSHSAAPARTRQMIHTLWSRNRLLATSVLTVLLIAIAALLTAHFDLQMRLTQTRDELSRTRETVESLSRIQQEQSQYANRAALALLAMAQQNLANNDSAEALLNIQAALSFNPSLADGWLYMAGIRILSGQFTDARLALESHMQTPEGASSAQAQELVSLCIRAERTGVTPYGQCAEIFRQLGLDGFAAAAKAAESRILDQYTQKITSAWPQWDLSMDGRLGWPKAFADNLKLEAGSPPLRMEPDGTLTITLYGLQAENLEPLRGLPISHLSLTESTVTDLSALVGMPLVYLNISQTSITDLSPIRGLPLQAIIATRSPGIRDLSALQGMKLAFLDIEATQVEDLSPLQGMPIQSLSLMLTPVSDISPLKGMPLDSLNLRLTRVFDLSPLQNSPITRLALEGVAIKDLTPLKGLPLNVLYAMNLGTGNIAPLEGMKLKYLSLAGSPVSDLSPISQMPLEYLDISQTRLADLSPLRGSLIRHLYLRGTAVSNLAPLRGMPLQTVDISNTPVADISPLRSLPLQSLSLADSRVTNLSPLEGMKLCELFVTPENMRDGGVDAIASMETISRMGVLVSDASSDGIQRVFRDYSLNEFLSEFRAGAFRQ